jgi:type I restriction enzyme, S subunit
MNEWTKTPFGQLLLDSKDGEWGQGDHAVGLRETTIIRGTDFLDLNDPNSEFPRRWVKDSIVERKRLRPGDIILETAGGTSTQSTGRSAIIKTEFFKRHSDVPLLCASFSRYLRLNTVKYCPQFIYYLLQSLYRTGYMAVFNIQHTGVSRFQYTAFRNHTELRIPGYSIQRKIAAVLSAYDELIDNNKRRITLLDCTAEEIYREWFVRLRFPGYEDVKFVKGLPHNWRPRRVKEIVVRKKFGRIYRESELTEEGPVVVIDQSRADYLGFHDGDPQHVATTNNPILLFGDHSCKMVLMTKPFSLAENVIPFAPMTGLTPYFLFHLVKDLAKTTEYKRHWIDLTHREVLVPNGDLPMRFEAAARPIFEQMELLRQANRNIEKTRLLLLARLISENLSVEKFDIQFPPNMKDELKPEVGATTRA